MYHSHENLQDMLPTFFIMLRLHYVHADHGSLVWAKRSAPWEFWSFRLHNQVLLGLAEFSHVLSRYPWMDGVEKGLLISGGSQAHWGSANGPPTMDARTFPHGLSHSGGVPHVSHVLINVWHVFHVLWRIPTVEMWMLSTFGTRFCSQCMFLCAIYTCILFYKLTTYISTIYLSCV